MSLDYNQSLTQAQNKIKAAKTYKAVKDDVKQLKQNTANNLEEAKQEVTSTLNDIKDAKKRYQRQVKTQFENLLDLAQSGIDDIKSGVDETKSSIAQKTRVKSSSVGYLKTKMVQAIKKIEPQVGKILFQEILHAVG
jgi:seryl-tRNA synthetase